VWGGLLVAGLDSIFGFTAMGDHGLPGSLSFGDQFLVASRQEDA
jgi:hypothetical protein